VPPDATEAPDVTFQVDLRTVSGWWYSAAGVQIRITPISDDPRYHFVSWIDRDKVPVGTEHLGPDDQRKVRARMEFEERLQQERLEAASTGPWRGPRKHRQPRRGRQPGHPDLRAPPGSGILRALCH